MRLLIEKQNPPQSHFAKWGGCHCEWHGDALKQAEVLYEAGETDFLDWESAKKMLLSKSLEGAK